MKIAEIEIHELQNIPITPPLFKAPVRAAVRLLEMKTDNGMKVIQPSYGFPDVCMAVRYFSGAK